MQDLKQLFTQEDFDFLNKAIDSMPKSEFGSSMLTEMLFAGLGKDENKEQREKEREERMEEMKRKMDKMEEQGIEVKFKLLQLKKLVLEPQKIGE